MRWRWRGSKHAPLGRVQVALRRRFGPQRTRLEAVKLRPRLPIDATKTAMEETAAAPCRATACEHKHARMVSAGAGRTNRGHFLWHPQHAPRTARRVAPRSRASSTANGRSVSPPAPLEASAPLVQSASSRSAEWTCVPSRAERVRSRTGAPRVHQRAVLQPDRADNRLAQGCVFEPQAVAPEEQSSVTRIDGAGLAAHTSKRPFETTRTRRAHRVPRWLRLEGGTSHALQTDEGQHREDFKHNCGGFDQRREWHR